MAKSRKKKQKQENEELLVDISQTTDKVTHFFEENQNTIMGVIIGLILIVGGYYAYSNFVKKPKQERAIAEIYQAELQFSKDSFALALTNPGGGFLGFLDIIDEYSGTATANLAKYYSGICYLNLGEFNDAIDYLEDFSTSDDALSISKYGAIGDAYSELGEMDKARSNYKKAVNQADISSLVVLYLEKLGLLSLKEGDNDSAKEYFNRIAKDYPNTLQAREVEKYLAMLNG